MNESPIDLEVFFASLPKDPPFHPDQTITYRELWEFLCEEERKHFNRFDAACKAHPDVGKRDVPQDTLDPEAIREVYYSFGKQKGVWEIRNWILNLPWKQPPESKYTHVQAVFARTPLDDPRAG